jgi:hypothetical protein
MKRALTIEQIAIGFVIIVFLVRPWADPSAWKFAFVAFAAVAIAGALVQNRRRGPRVYGWVPRGWRERVNAWYVGHGWAAPYDRDGNKVQPFWDKGSRT